ncbi:YchJ family protein [Pseudoalteromonas xiamenensis]
MKCNCCSNKNYDICCGRFHRKEGIPDTPEQLMRSRYAAYALGLADYILDTYTAKEQENHSIKDISEFANSCQFVRLEIINCPTSDQVEFKAYYLFEGKLGALHERSNFVQEDGRWKYRDGELFPHAEVKITRNDPCPCESGKKYKQCHLK